MTVLQETKKRLKEVLKAFNLPYIFWWLAGFEVSNMICAKCRYSVALDGAVSFQSDNIGL